MTASAPDFAAAAVYQGDFDDAGTDVIYLPTAIGDKVLERQGWTVEPVRGGGNAYVKPGCRMRANGGEYFTDYLWDRSEAIRLAITAEALRS